MCEKKCAEPSTHSRNGRLPFDPWSLHFEGFPLVGLAGFEPATSASERSALPDFATVHLSVDDTFSK